MRDDPYLVCDGGPLIVLPATAATSWDGGRGYENSLMEGGSEETEYDVVCSADPGTVVTVRGTDVLVGADGEWGGAFFLLEGHLLLVQGPPDDEDLGPLLRSVLAMEPGALVEMRIGAHGIRLVAGADNGDGIVWGYRDARIQRLHLHQLRVFFGAGAELIVDFGPS